MVVGTRTWRSLLRRSRAGRADRTPMDLALLAGGLAAVPAGLVLAAMVIGNAQASVAPLVLTMLYG